MTSPHRGAAARTLLAVVLLGAGLVPARADATRGGFGVGWSNAPRWRLPRTRAPECPRGRVGGRALVQVEKARCIETGLEGQDPPRPAPRPAPARPAPREEPPGLDAPREPPAPIPAPRPRPAPPLALGPTPDATALMQMGASTCHEYLRERDVGFVAVPADEAPEVAIPVRLRGPVAGVTFRIPWSSDEERDHHAVWDCRLVAAVVPLAEWLFARGVVEVQYFSALRRGKIVQQRPRSQHNIGLALDLYALRRQGEDPAPVEENYPRRVLRGCPEPAGNGAVADLYLGLVCLAAGRGLVHTLLTPDHDREHHNHLHLDLKAGQSSPPDPYISFHGL